MRFQHVKSMIVIATLLVAIGGIGVGSSRGQWQIASADNQSSLKFGFLVQGRAEWIHQQGGAASEGDWTSQNIYVRRMRLVFGGKLNDRVSFFGDTDSPNAGKVSSTGAKEIPDVFMQDFLVTWTHNDALRIDSGLLLTPGTYNHLQSAASLLAVDYGPYTFVETAPMKGKTGRDTGVMARGIVAGKHCEYRLGCYQGYRADKATQPFRAAGRFTFSPYAMDANLFYAGTSLGKKQSLLLGIGYDAQSDYRSMTADLLFDRPIGRGLAATFQADVADYDGGEFLSEIVPQTNCLLEVGITTMDGHLTPFTQIARQEIHRNGSDETTSQIGLAWWIDGFNTNLKAAWTRAKKDGAEGRDQFQLQCQVFSF